MNLEKLIDMLSYRRPAFSSTEEQFIDRFVLPSHKNARKDGFGNIIVDTVESPRILFSAHTDTVDYEDGFRTVIHDAGVNILHTANKDILGADDGAGVYVLLEMINANIPGRYVFHRDEESGANGANWILENTPEVLENIDHAIAFDRMGTTDVIDTMFMGRTATDVFVVSLCEALGNHAPATGSFTDTAFYRDNIKNCTNVSIGYYGQHTSSEFLDLEYFSWLVDRVKVIDWDSL